MSVTEKLAESASLLADLLAGRLPDERGRFGPYGGRFVPETLIPAHERLERGVRRWLVDAEFQAELGRELRDWVGRPTALSPAPHLSRRWGAEVWLKREDLAHTGAHKINNAIGQALLARRLGARRVVAETGAGQHGVASAAACARVGLPCAVYMGALDMERQAPNVGRMRLLGAKVIAVTSGDRTLRSAIDEALRDWVSDPTGTYYMLGSAVGAHPYPYLVRELQAVIGREARAQMLERTGCLPDALVACVGGGSNAIGLFHAFLGDAEVEILGIEAGGCGTGLGQNAATIGMGRFRRRTRSRRAWIIRASAPSTRCCSRSVACITRWPAIRKRSMRCANVLNARASCLRSRPPMRSPVRAAGRPHILASVY